MDTGQILELVSGRMTVIAAAAAICILTYLLPKLTAVLRLAAIPMVGTDLGNSEIRRKAYLGGARKLYNDGYKLVCCQRRDIRPTD